MKALIRSNEIYRELDWTTFTINHLDWSYTANPDGDGYALCEDCPEECEPTDFTIREEQISIPTFDGEFVTVTRLYATYIGE